MARRRHVPRNPAPRGRTRRPPSRLDGHVAVVAGATRGAGRGIAVELGAAGAIVYCTGRSVRGGPAVSGRPETIEETAELVTAGGGAGIPVRVDHTVPREVGRLFDRIRHEQHGRLDLLVNDVWGGDALAEWGTPFWQVSLEKGLLLLKRAVDSHFITGRPGVPLMIDRGRGLFIEVTDGTSATYRGNLTYDLAKASVIRLAYGMARDLRGTEVTALALSPGFLRSEAVLDHFGVTEATWRVAIPKDPYFAGSETPRYIGRAVVALATDPGIARKAGKAFGTWDLAPEFGFVDIDGARPHWARFYREARRARRGPTQSS